MKSNDVIKQIEKMKNPKIIILDEATNTCLINPTKYEIMTAINKERTKKLRDIYKT